MRWDWSVQWSYQGFVVLLLGIFAIWNAQQPFAFMEMISIDAKTNFFEKRVAEYTMAGVGQSATDASFSLEEGF